MEVLTIEQMTKLKELGVNTSEASMCYTFFESEGGKIQKLFVHDEDCYEFSSLGPIPTFTLQDIIELLTDGVENVIVSVNNEDYYIKCWEYKHYEENELKKIHFENIKQILNACYEMLIWVAENGYLKTK